MKFLKGLVATWLSILVSGVVLLGTAGLSAGAWIWPTAWAWMAAFTLTTIVGSGILAVLRPASFEVRQQGLIAARGKKQPVIDAVGQFVYLAFILAWLAFIPLDVFRLKMLPAPPEAISVAGLMAALAGLAASYVAIGQNPFAAPTIHDQSGNGQRVIDTGLYGVVRHPFYAGMLLLYAGTALWLGSYAALIGALGFLFFTLARIAIEEAWLREHLPAYAAYARRVRSRLIPYVL